MVCRLWVLNQRTYCRPAFHPASHLVFQNDPGACRLWFSFRMHRRLCAFHQLSFSASYCPFGSIVLRYANGRLHDNGFKYQSEFLTSRGKLHVVPRQMHDGVSRSSPAKFAQTALIADHHSTCRMGDWLSRSFCAGIVSLICSPAFVLHTPWRRPS